MDAPIGEWLHDGKVLCTLANALRAGSVKKIEESSMPFKQMENISAFLRAAKELECPATFETVDLFEEKDMGLVVLCLSALKTLFEGEGASRAPAALKLGAAAAPIPGAKLPVPRLTPVTNDAPPG